MTLTKTLSGQKLLVMVGDGADPETFAHPCLINTERGIQRTAETTSTPVQDCDDPEKPAVTEVEKVSTSTAVNGAGKLHTPSIKEWNDWLDSPNPKNCRIKADASAANGGGYWQGAFHLTSFEVTGSYKEKCDVSVSLVSTGPVTWVDAT
jgi:hypothetical protein